MQISHGGICYEGYDRKGALRQSILCSLSSYKYRRVGNPVHPGTRKKLREYGISTDGKYAVQLSRKDYDKYDYLIGMEQRNVTNMLRILGGDPEGKVRRLLDFSCDPRDIADPWYTGDFNRTYDDVYEGCKALLTYVLEQETEGCYC